MYPSLLNHDNSSATIYPYTNILNSLSLFQTHIKIPAISINYFHIRKLPNTFSKSINTLKHNLSEHIFEHGKNITSTKLIIITPFNEYSFISHHTYCSSYSTHFHSTGESNSKLLNDPESLKTSSHMIPVIETRKKIDD